MGRRLEDGLAHRDRIAAHALCNIFDESGDGSGLAGRHRAAADDRDQAILGIRLVNRALVMLIVVMMLPLSGFMAVVEPVQAPMGDRCRPRKAVIAVVMCHGAAPIGIGSFRTRS